MLDVDTFMVLYPGLTPGDVLDMDLDCFDALPVIREARMKADQWRASAGKDGPRFARHGPAG